MPEKPHIKSLSDEQLLENYKSGKDTFYLEELFGRYTRFVFLVCLKYLKNEEVAKDISVQVFEKAIGDVERFEIKHFKSWLYKVACNASLMQIRADKHFSKVSFDDEKVMEKDVENSLSEHHTNELNHEMKLEQLQKAMETLNDEQKQCIDLFYLQEKSYKDIVEITGFTENSVKSYIQNGKRNLHHILVKSFETGVWLLLILNMK